MLKLCILIVVIILEVNCEKRNTVQHLILPRKPRSHAPLDTGYVYTKGNHDTRSTKYDNQIARDYEHDNLKSKADNDHERFKSSMFYDWSKSIDPDVSSFKPINFHNDDEDIRTASANLYESWPYYYSSYREPKQRVDKRFIYPSADIKPVYENVVEDIPVLPLNIRSTYDSVPIDYYDNSKGGDDLITFKDISDELDNDKSSSSSFEYEDLDDYSEPITPGTEFASNLAESHDTIDDFNKNQAVKFIGGKPYVVKHKFKEQMNGDYDRAHHIGQYEENGDNLNKVRDLYDSFGNQHSSHDQNKDSKFAIKQSSHKAEKRKGFHRVYHKDEYKEDKDFSDDNDVKVDLEEKGDASAKLGGSNALLRSQAAAKIGNVEGKFKDEGQTERGRYKNGNRQYRVISGKEKFDNGYGSERNNNIMERSHGKDPEKYHNFKNLAKNIANRNYGDYIEHFHV